MAEDNFDPFEEEDAHLEDDAPYEPPVVNLGYQKETAAVSGKNKLSLSSIPLVRVGQILLVIAAILAYPAMAVMSHKLDDSSVVLDEGRYWAVPDVGVMSILVSRELDGPGWVTDKHRWRPQARLTALPAWQDSLLEALGDHGRLLSSLIDARKDEDLLAAVRLLGLPDETTMTPRLQAANEALARYDDRVAGGVALAPQGAAHMLARLGLTDQWASAEHAKLVEIANPGDGWIASTEAIRAVYSAKAKAHFAHEVLKASGEREAALLARHGAEGAFRRTVRKWQHAANLRPLFVSNQGSDGVIGANHPAILAFHLEEARTAQAELALRLSQPPAPADDISANTQTAPTPG